MTKSFSLALDALRFLAACCVLLDHLSSAPFTAHVIPPRLGAYGDISVTLFFVLSGFVIAHVVARNERDPASYAMARLSRLYSVALPAVAATFLADSLGAALNPGFYAEQKVMWRPPSLAGYGASLTFLNEFRGSGAGGLMPGSNAPFWSLSFEACYYALAGLILFAPRRWQMLTIPLLLFAAGPTIACLAPVWALGYFLYLLPPPSRIPRLGLAAAALGGAAPVLLAPDLFGAFDNFGIHFPWGCGDFNRNLTQDYGVALGFALALHALRGLLGPELRAAPALERLVRRAGALTFPLYCLHYPLLCLACAASPFGADDPRRAVLAGAGALVAAAALTPLSERLKLALRQAGLARGAGAARA
jgi:peptidoglycan/LPS O-acetylase OafA/YrhL